MGDYTFSRVFCTFHFFAVPFCIINTLNRDGEYCALDVFLPGGVFLPSGQKARIGLLTSA